MSADTISSFQLPPTTASPDATVSNGTDGGAGRGGDDNAPHSPLVVVQQGRGASPPRPAPSPSQGNTGNSLRNGYAAISHSVSGETAAIGLGFLLAGPVGAVIGGAVAPAALAALMWRSRNADHDDNTNAGAGNGGSDRSGSRDRSGGSGNRGRGNGGGRGPGGGTGRTNGPGAGGGRRQPHGRGEAGGGSAHKKPRTKDPIADKLGKIGKDLAGKLKNRTPKHGPHGKDDPSKNGKTPKATRDAAKDPRTPKDGSSKGLKDGLRDGLKVKDRGKQPDSDRPWRGRGDKTSSPKTSKTKKDRNNKASKGSGDVPASTSRDGLDPKKPKSGGGARAAIDEILDAELVDDDLPPKPPQAPADIIDGEVIDEDRIALVRAKREQKKRRAAIRQAKKAADQAARDGNRGDPHQVKTEVLRDANRRIDLEIHHENHRLALAATRKRRSTPVNYPATQAAPPGTRQAGVAIARQIDPRISTAYAILRAMAEQLARGIGNDDDADMGDHIVELAGIPNMCKNLSKAVQEAAAALARTAPLHPSVIKHLNNASVAARTAGFMADSIMTVFVQAHREDIFRVLEPRIGEERWNIRNAQGTLDAAKLRAAILSSQQRLALPSGSGQTSGGSKLVPASDASTRRLIALMQGFTKGHMVNVLSEVAGSAAGVQVVADSIGKLVHRMTKTWPTEAVVDDTVARTAGQVRRVATELRKAIKAAQRAHARELKLNAKGRAGKGARAERKWDVLTRRNNG